MSERDEIIKRIDEADSNRVSAFAASCVALVASGGWAIAGGWAGALTFLALATIIGATAFRYQRRVTFERKWLALHDVATSGRLGFVTFIELRHDDDG